MKMDYLKNIELALSLGFEEMLDENAYNGRFFKKDEKIWIHNIDALKAKLHVRTDKELKNLSYDVESYYKYVDHTNEMVDEKIEAIKAAIENSDSVLFGKHDFLYDKEILTGMNSLAKEGFDDEILADLAHQMSKGRS